MTRALYVLALTAELIHTHRPLIYLARKTGISTRHAPRRKPKGAPSLGLKPLPNRLRAVYPISNSIPQGSPTEAKYSGSKGAAVNHVTVRGYCIKRKAMVTTSGRRGRGDKSLLERL